MDTPLMDSYGSNPFSGASNPFSAASASPLSGDWSNYMGKSMTSQGWWKDIQTPYSYDQGYTSSSRYGSQMDYHPGGEGSIYAPLSGMTSRIIDDMLAQWHMKEFPELYDYSPVWGQQGVAGAGTVAQNPMVDGKQFGQFAETPEVYGEIQAAANKYGVPANFLMAIIAKESSGDWANNSTPACGIRGMCIHGYIGVFENAARAWGFNFEQGIGNRAYQIEMLAGGLRRMYDQLHAENPSWGWLNVAANHYSGDPTMQYTPPDSYQHGTTQQYVAEMQKWWQQLDAQAGNTWSNFTSTGQPTGVATPLSSGWSNVNPYDQMIVAAAQKYGVPANLVKAIIRLESNGNANAVSPQGATGLMQVMPMHVGGNQDILFDPAQNIDVGTRILMDNYRRYGSWEMAAKAYLGLGGADALGTTSSTYWTTVKGYWDELNAAGSAVFGGPTSGMTGPLSSLETIWGGRSYSISQGHGPSDFANAHPNWYGYSVGVLGTFGHPGIDVAFPRGTPIFSPGSGTVIRAGGSGSYTFYGADRAGVGELRIRMDNGDELILGHMMSISVRPNDRITPGMQVGLSGGDGTGDHLHLEYRTPDNSMSSGWKALDPREVFNGSFIPGGGHQSRPTGLGYTQPLTYKNLLLAAAKGEPIPQGDVYSLGGGSSGWNSMLRSLIQGVMPYSMSRSGQAPYQYLYNPGGGVPTSPSL
jgi:murein DD-endopeptidase MepM/ murein hydrolase activator NlpD